MFKITEQVLRQIIREEIGRSLDEASIIRRSAGGQETRREAPPESRGEGFRRKQITSIDDVRFKSGRDLVPGSPFIGGSDAFERTYNDGKLRFPVMMSRKVGPKAGDIESFMRFVDAPVIKEDDIVIVPELLGNDTLGAGVVTVINVLRFNLGDRDVNVPVASIKFPANARGGDRDSVIDNIGTAFLVRIGSNKTESGRDNMITTNGALARRQANRSSEPEVRTTSRSSGGDRTPPSSGRPSMSDHDRERLGLRRR